MASTNVLAGVAVSSTLAIVLVGVAMWWRDKRRRTKEVIIPDKWRRVGTLSELTIFPLKSGGGVLLEEAECTDIGIRTTTNHPLKLRDRFFIISGENGSMKTARQFPNLLLIKTIQADGTTITFTAPNMPDLRVQIPKGKNIAKKVVTMWRTEKVEMLDCGDEASAWFSSYLNVKPDDMVRLGLFYEEECGEPMKRRDGYKKPWSSLTSLYRTFLRYDTGAYSDLASYMLMAESSVLDLKRRVADKVPSLSAMWFRPNFVVKGSEPYEEDSWNFIKIGEDAIFQNFKPCTRCTLTTINPENGLKNPDLQPLRTLKTYRKLEDPEAIKLEGTDSPPLGRYLGLRRTGIVRMGDPVYVGE